jgi:ubiquinone/menaquinone biosynthesis C-methylase UbiE
MSPEQRIDPARSAATYYDSVAETWDTTYGAARQNRHFARQLHDSLSELLRSEAGRPIALELGAGTGAYLGITAPLFGKVIATDLSGGMLQVCARRIAHANHKNVEIMQQDACDLRDIGTGSVDVVYSIGLLDTISDYERLFAEAHRVLRRGGLVAGITSNGSCPWYRVRHYLEGGERHERTGQFATARRLSEVLQRTGFEPGEIAYWGAVPPALQNRIVGSLLAAAEAVVAHTPLRHYLGVLAFRARKPAAA